MAAKKNTRQATPRKTPTRRRPNKPVEIDNPATDMTAPTETVHAEEGPAPISPLCPAEAAETPAEPTAEAAVGAMPTASQEASRATTERAVAAAPPDKLSAVDAAAKVLGESRQALSCPELITAMAAKGYWQSPKGRTPSSTLYSALLRELHTKGEQTRFVKVGRGKFALRATL
jgi:HB1, ASXL, restriction endonuclease HTH domain